MICRNFEIVPMMVGNRCSPWFFEAIFFLNADLKGKKTRKIYRETDTIRTRRAKILQIIPIMNNNQDLENLQILWIELFSSTVYVKREKKKNNNNKNSVERYVEISTSYQSRVCEMEVCPTVSRREPLLQGCGSFVTRRTRE